MPVAQTLPPTHQQPDPKLTRNRTVLIGATMDTLGRRDSVDEAEASDIATDDLDEIGWFSEGPADPDHVVRV
jgi:hypothetical protein